MGFKRNILITGGAGFIGSHVVRLFVNKYADYHIVNLDKLTYAGNLANLKDIEDKPNYTFVKADICDFEKMQELMRQYHIDGIIHPPLWGPLGLIYLFKSVEKYNLFGYFVYWGKNSLNLMLTHYSITLVMAQIIFEKILCIPFYGKITLVAFACSLPIQHLFVYLVNRFAIKTLGKTKQ